MNNPAIRYCRRGQFLPAMLRLVPLLLALALTTLASPPRIAHRADSPQCAVRGYNKDNNAYSYSTKQSTSKACGSKCSADSDCASFAVGEDACLLYSVTLYGHQSYRTEKVTNP